MLSTIKGGSTSSTGSGSQISRSPTNKIGRVSNQGNSIRTSIKTVSKEDGSARDNSEYNLDRSNVNESIAKKESDTALKHSYTSTSLEDLQIKNALSSFRNLNLASLQAWQGSGAQLLPPVAAAADTEPLAKAYAERNKEGEGGGGGGSGGGGSQEEGVPEYDPSKIVNSTNSEGSSRSEDISPGADHAISNYLNKVEDISINNGKASKESIKYGSDFGWSLGYLSGLDKSTVSELESTFKNLGFGSSLSTLAITAGIRDASDITDAHKTIFADFSKQGNERGNAFEKYRSLLDKYMEQGIISKELAPYISKAEEIGNYSKSMTRSVGAFALLGSTVTMAKILKDPETAYNNGRGISVGSAIDQKKDHNGAFFGGSARGDYEGARALLGSLGDNTDIGHIEIYLGKGMTDTEFFKRIDTLNSQASSYSIGNNGSLTAQNGDTSDARAPWISLRQEGHGNPNGSYGVSGAFDKSDGAKLAKFGEKVYGSSFVLNCVACSNMKGSNSYGEWAANTISSEAAKNTQIFSHGAGVDTPLYKTHAFLGPGGIAQSLVGVAAPRIATTQGKTEITSEEKESMSTWGVDQQGLIVQRGTANAANSFDNFNFSSSSNFAFTDNDQAENNVHAFASVSGEASEDDKEKRSEFSF